MKKLVLVCFILSSVQFFAQDTKNVFVDVSAAYGIRLAKNDGGDEFEREYIENLRKGLAYDVSLFVRLKKSSNSFLGFKYNSFNKKSMINVNQTGQGKIGEYSDDVTISYYGLSYMYSEETQNKKGEFNFDLGLGYVNYLDIVTISPDTGKIKGGALGLYTSGSYYFKVANGFYLGPKIGALISTLDKITTTSPSGSETIELDKDEKIDLSRIDLALGARFKI